MSVLSSNALIEYPESDGRPMGETDWHIEWTLRLRELLKYRYQGQNVYVASDLLVYYHEGVPQDYIVPDGFVVLDCSPHRRRTFQTWKEQRVPNVVFEFTSKSTRRSDEVFKPRIYAEIGVPEYFLYDPQDEYLNPCLQGYRLVGEGTYVRIDSNVDGQLECQQLGITLEIAADRALILRDTASGEALLTEAESLARRNVLIEQELQRLRQALKDQDR
ncbi:MAG: Uma2 family endonuclease [Planctomycetaceae bacterium]